MSYNDKLKQELETLTNVSHTPIPPWARLEYTKIYLVFHQEITSIVHSSMRFEMNFLGPNIKQ